MLKVSMAKQNAVTKVGRDNMLEMVSEYKVGEKDNTGKVKQYNKKWPKELERRLFGFLMQHIILMFTILIL